MSACLVGGVLSLWALAAEAYEVETLAAVGPSANRIDVVFLGDGYRSSDQSQLTADVQTFLDALWAESTFGEYRNYFNIKVIHVVSNQNGGDGGSYGATRDTALGAYFNCADIPQLVCVDTAAVYAILASHTPDYDVGFVIVNDPTYGGSGGDIAVMSVNTQSAEVGLHEFGHSFANLADEYDTPYPSYPACGSECAEPNVTLHHTRESVKWNVWLDAGTPVPTPETTTYQRVVGVFEGARYQATGLYRPMMDCKMRLLGVPYCPVCTEANVWGVYDRVSPIDSLSPAAVVTTASCGDVVFSVAHPDKAESPLVVWWSVDGERQAQSGDSFRWGLLGATAGTYTIVAHVEDDTALVRRDPESLLVAEATWYLTLTADCAERCEIDGLSYDAGAANPTNPCETCLPGLEPHAWSAQDGVACSDGEACTEGDLCHAGACVGGADVCGGDAPTPDKPTVAISDGCACWIDRDRSAQAAWLWVLGATVAVRRRHRRVGTGGQR